MNRRFLALLLVILTLTISAFIPRQDTYEGLSTGENIQFAQSEKLDRLFSHRLRRPSGPDCTDIDTATPVRAREWRLPAGTWTYSLNPSSAPSSIGANNFASIITQSFATWDNALAGTSNKPTFQRGEDTTINQSENDGKNVIAWGQTPSRALAMTYIRHDPATGLVYDVDTIINNKNSWSWTTFTSNACGDRATHDVQAVMTHEIGHWLGLADETSSAHYGNTMYNQMMRGEIRNDTLSSGDKAGLLTIYH